MRARWLGLTLILFTLGCGDDDDGGGTTSPGDPNPAAAADAGGAVTGVEATVGRALAPIPPPVVDDCITNVAAGDHTFVCQDKTFSVMVDPICTQYACGLIFDVHGAAMSASIMRSDTQLHQLAPPKGYLVVHPSAAAGGASGAWNLETDPPILADFMTRMIRAFHVDQKRVHVTGFSMGAAVTFWFLCNHRDVLASTAPVTGSSASMVRVAGTDQPCIESIDANWRPRVPILFMSGNLDNALTIEAARARTEGIVTRLGLTGGEQIEGDPTYTRKRWTGADGMVFDFLEHGYSTALAGLGGHCIPGGEPGAFVACELGGNSLHWGKVVLQWFLDHPKP